MITNFVQQYKQAIILIFEDMIKCFSEPKNFCRKTYGRSSNRYLYGRTNGWEHYTDQWCFVGRIRWNIHHPSNDFIRLMSCENDIFRDYLLDDITKLLSETRTFKKLSAFYLKKMKQENPDANYSNYEMNMICINDEFGRVAVLKILQQGLEILQAA